MSSSLDKAAVAAFIIFLPKSMSLLQRFFSPKAYKEPNYSIFAWPLNTSTAITTYSHICNNSRVLYWTEVIKVQGVPFEKLKFQMAVSSKVSIFNRTMLVKPKCVWEVAVFWKIVNKQLQNVNKFSKIKRNCHLSNTFWL